MVNFGKIYVGNLGTDFQLLCQTTDVLGTSNTPTDLSQAATIKIILTTPNPNSVETSYVASALNPPGTDGIAHFITSLVTSIWTQPGFWTARVSILFIDGTKADSNDVSFQVLP